MVVLDTNVVSETMRAAPSPEVMVWMDSQRAERLFVAAVTEAEIRAGVAFLPEGVRRRNLTDAAERAFARLFADRILPFDSRAARVYAEVAARRRRGGRPISLADCQIAAIALSRGMTLATRNVRDFSDTGVELIDPWTAR